MDAFGNLFKKKGGRVNETKTMFQNDTQRSTGGSDARYGSAGEQLYSIGGTGGNGNNGRDTGSGA